MNGIVALVGAGRMGLALGAALHDAEAVDGLIYFGRAQDPPPHPLFDGAARNVEYRMGCGPVPDETVLVVLAVPDDALYEVANDVARAGPAPRGCAAVHLSGALSTDVLAPLGSVGYAVGSMHPLQTVADAWSGAGRLRGAGFALAGDPAALVATRQVVAALDGRPLVIPPALRPLYHAAAVFASNYVVAAAAAVARTLGEAGVAEEDAVAAALPLMRGTMDNVEQLGFAAALTGPIARGDVDTVRLHLARLSARERTLYSALGLETLRLARAAGLEPERADALESLLSS